MQHPHPLEAMQALEKLLASASTEYNQLIDAETDNEITGDEIKTRVNGVLAIAQKITNAKVILDNVICGLKLAGLVDSNVITFDTQTIDVETCIEAVSPDFVNLINDARNRQLDTDEPVQDIEE